MYVHHGTCVIGMYVRHGTCVIGMYVHHGTCVIGMYVHHAELTITFGGVWTSCPDKLQNPQTFTYLLRHDNLTIAITCFASLSLLPCMQL